MLFFKSQINYIDVDYNFCTNNLSYCNIEVKFKLVYPKPIPNNRNTIYGIKNTVYMYIWNVHRTLILTCINVIVIGNRFVNKYPERTRIIRLSLVLM